MAEKHNETSVAKKLIPKIKSGKFRFAIKVLFLFIIFCFIVKMAALFYNNISIKSDESFSNSLDESIDAAVAWVLLNKKAILETPNAALLKMLDECDKMHKTDSLKKIVNSFMFIPSKPDCWKALIDPNRPINQTEFSNTIEKENIDNKWILYAIGKEKTDITPEQIGLFNYNKWKGRKLTHQLWAIIHLRERSLSNDNIERLIEHLSNRIVKQLNSDIAVVDIYIQRIAFVLRAGHPDKIRRRWIERVIENQDMDGGWNDQWLCFTSGRRPVLKSKPTNPHTTIQALWLLYQVKYKYPEHFGMEKNKK